MKAVLMVVSLVVEKATLLAAKKALHLADSRVVETVALTVDLTAENLVVSSVGEWVERLVVR